MKGDKIICGACAGTGKRQSRDAETLKLVTTICDDCNGVGNKKKTFSDILNESLENFNENPR